MMAIYGLIYIGWVWYINNLKFKLFSWNRWGNLSLLGYLVKKFSILKRLRILLLTHQRPLDEEGGGVGVRHFKPGLS